MCVRGFGPVLKDTAERRLITAALSLVKLQAGRPEWKLCGPLRFIKAGAALVLSVSSLTDDG